MSVVTSAGEAAGKVFGSGLLRDILMHVKNGAPEGQAALKSLFTGGHAVGGAMIGAAYGGVRSAYDNQPIVGGMMRGAMLGYGVGLGAGVYSRLPKGYFGSKLAAYGKEFESGFSEAAGVASNAPVSPTAAAAAAPKGASMAASHPANFIPGNTPVPPGSGFGKLPRVHGRGSVSR